MQHCCLRSKLGKDCIFCAAIGSLGFQSTYPDAAVIDIECFLEKMANFLQDAAFVRTQKEVQQALGQRYCSSKTTGALHDRKTTSSLQPISSKVVDVSMLSLCKLVLASHIYAVSGS